MLARIAGTGDAGKAQMDLATGLLEQAAALPPIRSAAEAFDVFDFESVARSRIPIAHRGYPAGGVDSDATVLANGDGFAKWVLRPRRLLDSRHVDGSVTLLGAAFPTPIVFNPVGFQKAFHALGELAVARAAKAKNHLQVLSTVSTTSIADVVAARVAPVWY